MDSLLLAHNRRRIAYSAEEFECGGTGRVLWLVRFSDDLDERRELHQNTKQIQRALTHAHTHEANDERRMMMTTMMKSQWRQMASLFSNGAANDCRQRSFRPRCTTGARFGCQVSRWRCHRIVVYVPVSIALAQRITGGRTKMGLRMISEISHEKQS